MRCIPQNRVINEYSPFGQHHTYLSAHPMAEMLSEEYFLSEYNVLMPGDTVRVVQVKSANIMSRDNEVIAYCDLIVVKSSRDVIQFHVDKGPVLLGEDAQPRRGRPPKQQAEPQAAEATI